MLYSAGRMAHVLETGGLKKRYHMGARLNP